MPGGDRPEPRLTNPAEAANAASSLFEAMPAGGWRACLVLTAAELSVVLRGRTAWIPMPPIVLAATKRPSEVEGEREDRSDRRDPASLI
jgi:hypothetical protein